MNISMAGITQIRKAVTKHRGGLKNATDDQILTIWRSLDDETQKKYLEKVKDAAGDKSKRKI